jgi:hypothetical protein
VTDDLELLIVAMARHHHCSLAAATRQIRDLIAKHARSIVSQVRRMATTIMAFAAGSLRASA